MNAYPKLLVPLVSLLISGLTLAQTKSVKLDNIKLPYQPKLFYVTNVVDERKDTGSIGTIEWPAGKKIAYNYVNGVSGSLSDYLKKNIWADTTKLPVEIHFRKLEVLKKNINHKDEIYMDATYDVYHEGINIYYYSGWVTMPAKLDPAILLPGLTVHFMDRSLPFFDDWLTANKDYINRTVIVEPIVPKVSADKDKIIYSPQRLLTMADFQGPIDSVGKSMDAWISYRYTTENKVNRRTIKFEIEPYFNKAASFIIDKSDATYLNYLQALYDIIGLKACELYGIVRTTAFSYENVYKELDKLYRETEISLLKMQEQYNKETNHSFDEEKNVAWIKKVRQQLSNCSCYH